MRTNAFLVRYNGGWAERVDAGSIASVGRLESLLGLGALASLAEASRVADSQLGEFARERVQTDVSVLPVDESDTPYLAFGVGDTVSVEAASHRVLGVTVTEDNATGRAMFVPTLNDDVVLDWQERVAQAVRKMIPGTLGGRSKVAQPVVPVYVPRGLAPELVPEPDLPSAGPWEGIAALPGEMGGFPFMAFSDGSRVFVAGQDGYSGLDAVPILAEYNVGANTFTTRSAPPFVLGLYGWGAYDGSGKWVVFSRDANDDSDHLLTYDIGADSWTDGLTLPSQLRNEPAVGGWGGGIVVAGGGNMPTPTTVFYDTVEQYDTFSDAWFSLAAMPDEIGELGGTVDMASEFFYVRGGKTAGGNVSKFYRYDTNLDTWDELTVLSPGLDDGVRHAQLGTATNDDILSGSGLGSPDQWDVLRPSTLAVSSAVDNCPFASIGRLAMAGDTGYAWEMPTIANSGLGGTGFKITVVTA